MLNLSIVLEDSTREFPDRTALVFGDLRLPYSLVDTVANQVANLLVSRGIGKGDKVALACPNLPYFPFVYYGILKAGATVVPLNVLLQSREIAYHLDDSDAKALFCFEGSPELPLGERGRAGFENAASAEHFFVLPAAAFATESEYGETLWAALDGVPGTFETVQTSPDDTAVILYTSGTTGQPKGAELTHQNMLLNAMVSDEMFPRTEGGDAYLAVLPLFHSFGQTVVMNAGFRRHATVVLMPRFEPGPALELCAARTSRCFAGVPTMYWAMLDADPRRRRRGAAPRSRSRVGGRRLLSRRGAQGLRGHLRHRHPGGLRPVGDLARGLFNQLGRPTKPGSIGTPIWGVEMKLVDGDWKTIEGEVPARSRSAATT